MFISSKIESFFIEIGELTFFAHRFVKEVFSRPFEFKELLRQCYSIGNKSLFLVDRFHHRFSYDASNEAYS